MIDFVDWVRSTELPEEFDEAQQYRDFRAVLFEGDASPQQCRRVLATILHKGGLWTKTLTPLAGSGHIDPLALAAMTGAQDLCRDIVETLLRKPSPAQPDNDELEI